VTDNNPDPRFLGGAGMVLTNAADMAFVVTLDQNGAVDMQANIERSEMARHLRTIADHLDPRGLPPLPIVDGECRTCGQPTLVTNDRGDVVCSLENCDDWSAQTHDEPDEIAALVSLLAEVVESLMIDDDECVHVLWEPEPGNPHPTAPALRDDLWCRIRKVVES
jgi:small ligand-binding sensory domain FIST